MCLIFSFTNVNQSSKKKLKNVVRLVVPAKGATMSPPIGPVLGQYGINIMEFCKQFNDKTKDYHEGVLLTVLIYQYIDKSFTFSIKNIVNSFLLKDLLPVSFESDIKIHKMNIIHLKDLYYLSLLNKKFFSLFTDRTSFSNLKSIMRSCGLVLVN